MRNSFSHFPRLSRYPAIYPRPYNAFIAGGCYLFISRCRGGRMKYAYPRAVLFLAALMLMPQVAQAHSLNPMYAGFGVYSLYPIVASYGLFLAPLLLMHALTLRLLVTCDRGFLAVLWRAAAIFCCSKFAEFLASLFFIQRAWQDWSVGGTAFFSGTLFTISFSANLLLIGAFFRKDAPAAWKQLLAACILSASSYAMTMLFIAMAYHFRWV